MLSLSDPASILISMEKLFELLGVWKLPAAVQRDHSFPDKLSVL